MRYFEIKAALEKEITPNSKEDHGICEKLSQISAEYCEDEKHSFCACVTNIRKKDCVFIFGGNGTTEELHTHINTFWDSLSIEGKINNITEISAKAVMYHVYHSRRRNIEIHDDADEHFGVENLQRTPFHESIVEEISQEKLKIFADSKHLPSLSEEGERIFSCPVQNFSGHPVHYIILNGSSDSPKQITEHLIGALLTQKRIQSGRVIYYVCSGDFSEHDDLINLYQNIQGGTICISFSGQKNHGRFASRNETDIQFICNLAAENQNKVLTVFDIPKDNRQLEQKILYSPGRKIAFVSISEKAADREASAEYLKNLAEEKGIADSTLLIEMLGNEEKVYFISDLNRIFDEFYATHMRTALYPAYSAIELPKVSSTKAEGDASRQLDEMIGLSEVKSIVRQSVSFFRMQKIFQQRNIPLSMPARSMVFTGNPGTAKTTVARLIARIFKDNNLLSKGNLIEVGRADLVGKYVGWTACQVKEAFAKAHGSVLFIDEAYSLVDDIHGNYGDEAINTIVQEMENNRHDTVVIFAGYPDEMEQFLSRNPGLRSRIAFHVHFPDYTEDELVEILKLTIRNKSMILTGDAEKAARTIISEALKTPDFGNGRFIRSLSEKAVMQMSERLAEINCTALTDTELVTLQPEDFNISNYIINNKPKERVRIGF